MNPRDRDLDLAELEHLLGNCLSRIDQQALQLLHGGRDAEPSPIADTFEEEASELQQLVDSILRVDRADKAECASLDAVVTHCVQGALQRAGHPVVLRQRLAGNLPPVACGANPLTHAIQRALALGTAHAGSGGEVALITRSENGAVLFELQTTPGAASRGLDERSLTLRAFVAELGGECDLSVDSSGALLLAIELPAALGVGRRT